MSQHHFFTTHKGEITHILMGWDRPLQGYFLVIKKESDRDEAYWSNLDCDISHPKTLEPFMKVLEKLNITLPKQMLKAIELDGAQNRGNRQVIHTITPEGYECMEGIDPCKTSLSLSGLL